MKTIQRALTTATCFLLLAASPAIASAQSLVRGPYLQTVTQDSAIVVWATDAPTSSEVRYGASPAAPATLDRAVIAEEPTTHHQVTLTGLSPDTRYHYTVGSIGAPLAGGDGSASFATAPAPGTPRRTRVWSLGDPGYYGLSIPVREAMLAYLGGRPADLLIHTGDLNHETGTPADYDQFFFQPMAGVLRSTPLWPTMGNHDGWTVDLDTQTGAYFDLFALPADGEAGGVPSGTEAYYSWDHANIHFVALETYWWDDSPDGPMIQWLEDDLAATDQEWLIAYLHYPPYTRSHYDSDTAQELTAVREVILPVLEGAGVDLVLSGHAHMYERSYLVNGAYDTPTTAAGHVLDSGDGAPLGGGPYEKWPGRLPHDGTVYVNCGIGGSQGAGPGDHPLTRVSARMVDGSCLIDIHENRLSFLALRSDGSALDRFAIVKGDGFVLAGPEDGAVVHQAEPHEIRWATAGEAGEVRLDLSLDDGATWAPIAGPVPNAGRFAWTPPAVTSQRALVRVSDAARPEVRDESNAAFTITARPQPAIPFGDVWRYDDRGVDLGGAWIRPDFDDSAWSSGAAELGYGDWDERTLIRQATPSYPTAYFRKTVRLDAPVDYAGLKVRHDDGVVVWINGVEVLRRYVDTTDFASWASSASVTDNQVSAGPVPLSPSPFVIGDNVVAAMVKQAGPDSGDLTFDLELSVAPASAIDGSGGSGGGGTGGTGGTGGGDGTPVTTCATLQRGLGGVIEDATIYQATPTWADSASPALQTGSTPGTSLRMAALRFDLSFIPQGAEVESATLTLVQGYKDGTSTVRAHRILVPWTERAATWNALAGHHDPAVIGEFVSRPIAAGDTGERILDLTALAQIEVDTGQHHGILLEESPGVRTQLRSSEHATQALRPRLEVCYTTYAP